MSRKEKKRLPLDSSIQYTKVMIAMGWEFNLCLFNLDVFLPSGYERREEGEVSGR